MKAVILALCLMVLASPAFAARTFYIDYVAGADTNNGTSTSTPWKRLPGMVGCANTCASTTPTGDDNFILKGGVTWPNAALGVNWTWQGTSGHSIYIGVDQSWYAGGSWARPIFDCGGTACAGNSNKFFSMDYPYLTLDNIEFTGLYWTGTPAFNTSTYIVMSSAVGNEVKNSYFHGWTHAAYPTATENSCVIQGNTNIPNLGTGSSFHDNTIDGTDTDGVSCGAAIFGGPPTLYNNTIRYVTSAMIINGCVSVHDNLIENITISFDPTTHENGIEDNGNTGCSIYNNTIRHLATGAVTLWTAPNAGFTSTVYNNLIYDTGANNVIDIAHPVTNGGCSESGGYCVNAGTVLFYNNTVECGPDSAPTVSCGATNDSTFDGVSLTNNHFITTSSPAYTCGTKCTLTTGLTQSLATANGQGFTSAQTYPFSSTACSNSTVDVGTSLAGTFTIDRLGVTRPQTCSTPTWDIGAYEYNTAAPVIITSGRPRLR